MLSFAMRRLLQFIPTVLAVTLLIFVIINLLPGDAAFMRAAGLKRGVANEEAVNKLREKWGLNDPAHVRYFRFLKNLAKGDLGTSFRTDQPLSDIIAERLPVTLKLAGLALLFAVTCGVLLGFIAAVTRGSPVDITAMFVAISGVSIPEFFVGIVLMLTVALYMGLLPTGGYTFGAGSLKYLILPSIALGFRYIGMIARITRSSLLDELTKDYIKTAKAKGLKIWQVQIKHGLRNALVPIITIVGLESGWMFANTVVVEEVFALPGIGRLLIVSILRRDTPAMQASILIMVVSFLLINIIVDLLYGYLDPRIRYK